MTTTPMNSPLQPPDVVLPPAPDRLVRHRWALATAGLTLLLGLMLSTQGQGAGVPAMLGPLALAYTWLTAGIMAVLYLAAGVGLGWPIVALLRGAGTGRAWLQVAVGTAGMLWLCHALGVLGLLSGARGLIVGHALLLTGLALLTLQVLRWLRGAPRLGATPWTAVLGVGGGAVLLVASASPPGWLWTSEAGGYDALSYHLQLPMEWARAPEEGGAGRLRPLEHNVYSYLPGYVEAVYLHVNAMLGGGLSGGGRPVGLLGMQGLGLLVCHFIHAGMALLGAALTGRAAWMLLTGAGLVRHAAWAGGLSAAAAITTPWLIVVGSLAYNEAGVVLLFAGAILAAGDELATPWRRGLAVGLLVGAACGCKPTALYLIGPTAGLLLLAWLPGRARGVATLACVVGGALAFGPPLVRNALAGGNPVFPAGTAVFGRAHWTPEQVARFRAAHAPDAPPLAQLARLLDTRGDPGAPLAPDRQPRGLFHEQWSVLFPAGLIGLGLMLLRPGLRAAAGIMLLGIAGAAGWWAVASHGQSRFLLPLVVPLSIALGCAAAVLAGDRATIRRGALLGVRRVGVVVVGSVPLLMSATAWSIFLVERGGMPNLMLATWAEPWLGESLRRELLALDEPWRWAVIDESETIRSRPPQVYVNLLVDPTQTVYLLGDATPLYFTGRVLYHTTWDRSPLGDAVERFPEAPAAWRRALHQRGVRWVLHNPRELERLWASGAAARAGDDSMESGKGSPGRTAGPNDNQAGATGWYDPRVTPQVVARFIAALGPPEFVWGDADRPGAALYRLTLPTPPRPPLSADASGARAPRVGARP